MMKLPEVRQVTVKTCRNLLKNHSKLKEFEFNVHYVDSGGAGKKTILAVHGSPGSHNDFRELIPKLARKDFRVISVNLPGHGRTPIDPYWSIFRHSTAERTEFLKDFLQALNLPNAGCYPLISYMAEHQSDTALLMINSLGVTPHKLARPYWFISGLGEVYQTWPGRWLLRPMYYAFCRYAFGPVKNVDYAAVVFAMGAGIGYEKIPSLVKSVGASNSRPILFLYSKNDHMIELEKSTELAEHLGIPKENCHNFCDNNEKILHEIGNVFKSDGQKAKAAILFDKDGHYVHKKRTDLITDLIGLILK